MHVCVPKLGTAIWALINLFRIIMSFKINSRFFKYIVAVCILALVIFFVITRSMILSDKGIITAPLIQYYAPIDGQLTLEYPEPGRPFGVFFPKGSLLFTIKNPQVTSEYIWIEPEIKAIETEIISLTNIEKNLKDLATSLDNDQKIYLKNYIEWIAKKSLIIKTSIKHQKEILTLEKEELKRHQNIEKHLSTNQIENLKQAVLEQQSKVDTLIDEEALIEQQLQAAHQGTFIHQGNNPVPYAKLSQDQFHLKLFETQEKISSLNTKLSTLNAKYQLKKEEYQKSHSVQFKTKNASFLWQLKSGQASYVKRGQLIMELAQCQAEFISVLVSHQTALQAKIGELASIEMSQPDEQFQAKLIAIKPHIDNQYIIKTSKEEDNGIDSLLLFKISEKSTISQNDLCKVGQIVRIYNK